MQILEVNGLRKVYTTRFGGSQPAICKKRHPQLADACCKTCGASCSKFASFC